MALSNYAQLQGAVADWLERGDLAARIPDFIALAEARFNRVLRLRMMEVEAALTLGAGARKVALPSAFREPIALWRATTQDRCALRFVDPAGLEVCFTPGRAASWTVDGPDLAFDRPADRSYDFTLRFLGRLALSDAAPTNALLTDYPDLYLFGALAEAAPYLRDADLLNLVLARLDAALSEARAKEARARSLTTLGIEPVLAGAAYDIVTG